MTKYDFQSLLNYNLYGQWCRTVGHENTIKLMLLAVNLTLTYQLLLEICVCDLTRSR